MSLVWRLPAKSPSDECHDGSIRTSKAQPHHAQRASKSLEYAEDEHEGGSHFPEAAYLDEHQGQPDY
jgi:hypothetical protein